MNNDRRLLQKTTDRIVQAGVVLLIISSPLMFGAVYPWAYSFLEWTIAIIVAAWLIRLCFVQPPAAPNALNTRIFLPAFLFIMLIFVQLLPLPPTLLRLVSPKTAELYHVCLSDVQHVAGSHGLSLSLYRHATRTELLKCLSYIMLLALLINYKPEGSVVAFFRRVVSAICISGAAVALIGLGQKLLGAQRIYGFWSPLSKSDVSFMGPFVNANHFAGYIELTCPIAAGLYAGWLSGQLRRTFSARHGILGKLQDPSYNKAALAFVGILLIVASLFISLSRAGVASFVISLGIIVFIAGSMEKRLRPQHRTRMARFTLIASAVIFLSLLTAAAVVFLTKTSQSGDSSGNIARLQVWADTLKMYTDFPLVGIGLGTFSYVYPIYRSQQGLGAFTHAENDYLQALVETGSIGFLLLLWFFGGIGWEIIKTFKEKMASYKRSTASLADTHTVSQRGRRYSVIENHSTYEHRPYPLPRVNYFLFLGCLASLTSILIHSCADFNMHIPSNALLWFVLLALAYRLPRLNKPLFSFSRRNPFWQ